MIVHRKQPNATTYAAQLSQWTALVLSWTKFHRVFRLDLGEQSLSGDLWSNKDTDRELILSHRLIAFLIYGG